MRRRWMVLLGVVLLVLLVALSFHPLSEALEIPFHHQEHHDGDEAEEKETKHPEATPEPSATPQPSPPLPSATPPVPDTPPVPATLRPSATPQPTPSKPPTATAPGKASHVLVLVLENHSFDQIIGSSEAPYLNDLAQRYGLATNYQAVSHPSLPNYLALTGGSTFGINSDCTSCSVNAPNLADQLEAKGFTWKAYLEGMPSPCYPGATSASYAKK